jgi:hypothetical protein
MLVLVLGDPRQLGFGGRGGRQAAPCGAGAASGRVSEHRPGGLQRRRIRVGKQEAIVLRSNGGVLRCRAGVAEQQEEGDA